ncbi:MAG: flippase-like domain-containing protein [Clostridia bacterium]|nr:flippase-like domain-containing protein [Clostridia bacterium]
MPDNELEQVNTQEKTAPDEEVQAEGVDCAELPDEEMQTVQPPKKGKYGWVGYVLLLVVIALGIYLMFHVVYDMGEDVKSFDEVIMASDWRFALITLAVILAIFMCLWFEYAVVMKTTTGKFRLVTSLKVAFLGKFYDNITPFATGGQPMQIYYLNKKGLGGGVSSAVVLIRYFAWMFSWIILDFIFMAAFTNVLDGQPSRLLLLIAGWIGLGINVMLPLLLILFVVMPKFSRAITGGVITLGHKIRIVKDKDKMMERVDKMVEDFRSSFAIMSKSPLKFITLILLCLIEIFLFYAFPYFVMKMFSGLSENDGISVMLTVMALNVYATLSASVVPTPGNSGAIEGLVTAAFSVIAGNVLLWTVFFWRFGIYYIYIIIGIFITIFEFIRKLVRTRKKKNE